MESRGVAGSGRFIAAAAADAPVQIAAGVLILLGVLLGYTVNGGFFLLSGAVGAGLTFAGVTGFCGMARLLATMPWNRRRGLKRAPDKPVQCRRRAAI